MNGNHSPFKDGSFEYGWLYCLHLRLTKIFNTDLMNASYIELSKDIYLLSITSSKDPDIPSDIPVVTTTITPTPTNVDQQKEK